MKSAYAKDDELIQAIRDAQPSSDAFDVWWLGQSGFLIVWNGRHLLFDPYLSDSLTRKYATTDKPHTRITELVVDPARLDFLDVVTSSHNHTDHLDGETLSALLRVNSDLELIVPAANCAFAADRLQLNEERLTAAEVGKVIESESGFRFHAVPAAHDEVELDEQGRHRFVGYVVEFGDFAVYHSGDTRLFDGMVDVLNSFDIDLALLPINGKKAERRVAGNLWGREAAQLAKDIGAGLVVPCHYDMFEFNTETPDEFESTCRAIDQSYCTLQNGESLRMEDS